MLSFMLVQINIHVPLFHSQHSQGSVLVLIPPLLVGSDSGGDLRKEFRWACVIANKLFTGIASDGLQSTLTYTCPVFL